MISAETEEFLVFSTLGQKVPRDFFVRCLSIALRRLSFLLGCRPVIHHTGIEFIINLYPDLVDDFKSFEIDPINESTLIELFNKADDRVE